MAWCWLCNIYAITWANNIQALLRHIMSLGHNELKPLTMPYKGDYCISQSIGVKSGTSGQSIDACMHYPGLAGITMADMELL